MDAPVIPRTEQLACSFLGHGDPGRLYGAGWKAIDPFT